MMGSDQQTGADASASPPAGKASCVLGPRPFRTVLLPAALACTTFAGWLTIVYRRGPVVSGATLAALAFAFATLVVVFAIAERRRDLVPWLVIIGAGWVVIDRFAATTDVQATGLIGLGVLWCIALRSTWVPDGAPVAADPWDGSAALVAVFLALFGSIASVVPGSWLLGGVAAGFGLTVVAVTVVWPQATGAIDAHARQFVWVLTVVLMVVPLGTNFGMTSPQPMVVGATAAAGACALAVGPQWLRLVGGLAIAAALMQLVVPEFIHVAVLALVLSLVSVGAADPVLAAARQRLGPKGDRWFRGSPLVWWVTVGLVLLQVTPRQRASMLSLPKIGPGMISVSASPKVSAAVFAAAMVGLVLPWPVSVIDLARRLRPDRRARQATRSAWHGVLRFAAAGDRVVHTLGRGAVRALAPVCGPTRPAEALRIPPRPGVAAGIADYARPVALWFALTALVKNLAANASLSGGTWPQAFTFFGLYDHDPTGRVGWGTGDYWAIADHGYVLSEHREAFLPLVPVVLRWVQSLTGWDLLTVQVVVASVSGLACAVLFWAWMRKRQVGPRARSLALVLFLVFPWNFLLFGYGYADATVVALVLGAFLLLEYNRPLLAGIVAGLAAITRPNGVPMVAVVLVYELVRSGALRPAINGGGWGISRLSPSRVAVDLRRMRIAQWAAVVLSTLGLVAFSAFMWEHAGSPLYWMTQESYYGHEPITQLAAWLESLFGPWPTESITGIQESWNQLATAAVMLGALVAVPTVRRRFGVTYAFLTAVTIMIAWTGSRVFTPGARLLMPVTPFLAVVAATWLERRPRLAALTVVASLAGGLTLVVLFTRGGELWVGW